jgi:hypothetical protein
MHGNAGCRLEAIPLLNYLLPFGVGIPMLILTIRMIYNRKTGGIFLNIKTN